MGPLRLNIFKTVDHLESLLRDREKYITQLLQERKHLLEQLDQSKKKNTASNSIIPQLEGVKCWQVAPRLESKRAWEIVVQDDDGYYYMLERSGFISEAKAVAEAERLAKLNPRHLFIIYGPTMEVEAHIPTTSRSWRDPNKVEGQESDDEE